MGRDGSNLDNKDGELPVDWSCKFKVRSGHLYPKAMDPSAFLSWFKLNSSKLRKEDLLQRPLQPPVIKERLGVCTHPLKPFF